MQRLKFCLSTPPNGLFAALFIFATGTLPLGMGCAEEELVQAEVADDANTRKANEGQRGEWADMSPEERLAAVEERMQAAVESGHVDQAGADLRILGMKIKAEGSEELKAEMEEITKPFTAEKLRIRAAIKDGSIAEADGKAQVKALHEELREDFEALAEKIE